MLGSQSMRNNSRVWHSKRGHGIYIRLMGKSGRSRAELNTVVLVLLRRSWVPWCSEESQSSQDETLEDKTNNKILLREYGDIVSNDIWNIPTVRGRSLWFRLKCYGLYIQSKGSTWEMLLICHHLHNIEDKMKSSVLQSSCYPQR